jgi:hypothetical protein
MKTETSYPLYWPAGWKRTPFYSASRFGHRGSPVSMSTCVDRLENELRRLGAAAWVISTNVRTKADGLPYARAARPNDPGAAVYFNLHKRRIVLACDKWSRPECNLWAIALHIEALRGQERWGVGSIEQAFAGYTALPTPTRQDPWEVLGVTAEASEEQISEAFKAKARTAHPDAGGSTEAFAALAHARDLALATVRFKREGERP